MGTRHVDTPDFSASKYMITNGEYLEFVQGSGYLNEKYWSKDGWGWRSHRNTKSPFWWKTDGPQGSNRFKLRNIFEEIDMPWDESIFVSPVTQWKNKQNCWRFRYPC